METNYNKANKIVSELFWCHHEAGSGTKDANTVYVCFSGHYDPDTGETDKPSITVQEAKQLPKLKEIIKKYNLKFLKVRKEEYGKFFLYYKL